ncbi:MAG: 30S ribosomal protein S5 [Patescibacteria group bacterium]|nr:30S ribosomal protein S5 [Patescibacteria group bacterium]
MTEEIQNNVDEKVEQVVSDNVVAENTPAAVEGEKAAVEAEASPAVTSAPVNEAPQKEASNKRFVRGGRPPARGGRGGGGRGGRRPGSDVPMESDYEEKNIEVARVTRVTKGGKRMRFRVLSVIGNHKGRVGYGLAKGADVAAATAKATTKARKSLITVPLVNETIPHAVNAKFAAAKVLLKPAPKGTGVKAGGPVRSVLELAGVPNVSAKILGSNNKVNNVKAIFSALKALKAPVKILSDAERAAAAAEANKPTAV